MPLQLPIGAESDFKGIIDLVEMKAIVYKDDLGKDQDVIDIPADLADAAADGARAPARRSSPTSTTTSPSSSSRRSEVPVAMLKAAIRKATLAIEITPVLCGSAFKNKGVQPLLDAVLDYLPSPLEVTPIDGHQDPSRAATSATRSSSQPDDSEPFAALGFKIMADPFVGKLTYFRVYSGTLSAGSKVLNVTTGRPSASGAS